MDALTQQQQQHINASYFYYISYVTLCYVLLRYVTLYLHYITLQDIIN